MTTNEALVERVASLIGDSIEQRYGIAVSASHMTEIATAIAALTPPAAEGEVTRGDRVTIKNEREVYGDGTVTLVEGDWVEVAWDKDPRVMWSFADDIERLAHAAPKVAGMEEAALRHIADADPGAQSDQSLAHEMAAVARQALAAAPSAPGSGEG